MHSSDFLVRKIYRGSENTEESRGKFLGECLEILALLYGLFSGLTILIATIHLLAEVFVFFREGDHVMPNLNLAFAVIAIGGIIGLAVLSFFYRRSVILFNRAFHQNKEEGFLDEDLL